MFSQVMAKEIFIFNVTKQGWPTSQRLKAMSYTTPGHTWTSAHLFLTYIPLLN